MKITYSIIVPIFNEKDNIPELYRRGGEVMNSMRKPWELILVDDGSTDGSTDMIRELAEKDNHVRPIIFARNFGHQIAITAGGDYARGDAVVIIDADLQDPPEVLPQFIAKWREGHAVVYAIREQRKEGWLKRSLYSSFYRMLLVAPAAPTAGVERVADVPMYIADPLVRRAGSLQQTKAARPPRARVHRMLLDQLGIAEGAQVRIRQGQGEAVVATVVDPEVPPAVVRLAAAHASTCALEALSGPVTVERA